MYGMNQAFNVPDPSAQVPNHLVSARVAFSQHLLTV